MTTRARIAAWTVFITMAGTTMSFQVYHSVVRGDMPGPLAYLYGIVPLFISMALIEVVSAWEKAKWARPIAYVITAGSMFLSASATGAVVLKAAPPHASLLFGLLLDGAAILAARFLMTGPEMAAATKEAERQAALDAAIAGRRQAEVERDTAVRAAREQGDTDRAKVTELSGRVESLRAQLAEALQARTEKPDPQPRKPRPRRTDGQTDEQKLGTEAAALAIIEKEPDISGSELGRRLGATPGYGRTLMRRLSPASAGGDS